MLGILPFMVLFKPGNSAPTLMTNTTIQKFENRYGIKVIPQIDLIVFENNEDDIGIAYARVYSDMPPSISNFKLCDICEIRTIVGKEKE